MKLDSIVYRQSTQDDLDGVIQLWEESQVYHSELDPRLVMREDAGTHVRTFYTEKFFTDNAVIMIAVLDEEIIGYASTFLQPRPPIHLEPFWGFIDALIIASRYRRHGIGTRLMKGVIEWLREKGIVTMRLSVAALNPDGIAFWKKMGFSEIMHLMDLKIDQ